MTKRNNLTQIRLKEVLNYDPETGIFTRLNSGHGVSCGDIAGTFDDDGYVNIKIDGKSHRAHRLAFMWMAGSFPPDEVDHINRIRDDNRWCNLRNVTHRENCQNSKINNNFIGVHFHKEANKWNVRSSQVEGQSKYLGLFKTHLAACYARWAYDNSNEY
jgi:hypothetical protein